MKTIPRTGGVWWPTCVLVVLLLLLPLMAIAQDGETGADVESQAGVAAEEAAAGDPAGASEEALEMVVPEEKIDTEKWVKPENPILPVYEQIESLMPGSTVLVAFDYDSADETTLYALSLAVLRHCFDNGLRVLAFTPMEASTSFVRDILPKDGADAVAGNADQEAERLQRAIEFLKRQRVEGEDLEISKWVKQYDFTETQLIWLDHLVDMYFGEGVDTGGIPVDEAWLTRVIKQPISVTYMELAFDQMAAEYSIEYGLDYIIFGYSESDEQVIRTAVEADYVIAVSSGGTVDWWVENLTIPYGELIGVGTTYAAADGYFGYLEPETEADENGDPVIVGPRFIDGMIRGLAGVAEYEGMIGHPGNATALLPRMDKYQVAGNFYAQDRANDEGGGFAIRWDSSDDPVEILPFEDPVPISESPDIWYGNTLIRLGYDSGSGEAIDVSGFEDWVYHSDSGEEGSWELIDVIPSNASYIWELPNYFGFFLSSNRHGTNEHYTFFENTYPAPGIYEQAIEYVGMPVMRDIGSLADFGYLIVLSAGPSIDLWLENGANAHNIPMAVGCISTAQEELQGYYDAGRINGLISGADGATIYEWLMEAELAEGLAAKEAEAEAAAEALGNVAVEAIPVTFELDYEGNPVSSMRIMRGFSFVEIVEEEVEVLEAPEEIPASVQVVFDTIKALEPGSRVLIAVDYGEGEIENLQPINEALYKHCFRKALEVVSVSLMAEDTLSSEAAYKAVKDLASAIYGTDFAILCPIAEEEAEEEEMAAGFDEAAAIALLAAMSTDFAGTFPVDYSGNPTDPDLLAISAGVYDQAIEDYSTLTVYCSLKPFGGEKVEMSYVPPGENEVRQPWENPFMALTSSADLTKVLTTKSYFILYSAMVEGHNTAVLEVQPTKDAKGNTIMGAADGEQDMPDNRDGHWFKAYTVPVGYLMPEGADFPPDEWAIGSPVGPVMAKGNIWNWARTNTALWALMMCLGVMIYIIKARGGASLFLRRIAGLDHVEEAIGRATEMGRPILYSTGLGYVSDIATIASLNILGQVARKVADYETRLMVPSRDPIVMAVCQEVVQEAYIDAGRPDSYNKDDVFFLTDDQFAYTAAVDGIMVREKPATIFLMGMFYAESLLLAETGASTGAIQIAGTDALAQLPFFITACDYTLIGEELYAASAYLSKEPLLLGSLKGQDFAKMVLMILTFIGTVVIMLNFRWEFFQQLFQAF